MVGFESPEGRVIRDCVAGRPLDDTRGGALDWDALMAAAGRHGVSALVAQHAASSAPERARRLMQAELVRSVASGMLQCNAIASILALLADAGVEALVFKGQPLSVEAYGETGMRASTDIDLLVRPDDADRAARALVAAGYRISEDLTDAEWRRVRRHLSEWLFTGRAVAVDLHWALTSDVDAFDLPADDVLAAARTLDLGTAEVRTLSREHLALYLAVHGCKHDWERFEWLASFRAVLEAPGLDREAVRGMALRFGAARRLAVAERLVARVFGDEADGGGDETIEAICERIVAGWFGPGVAAASPWESLRRKAAMFDRRFDVVRALATGVFSPRVTDWRAIPLPDALGFLYPLLRPVRLLLRGRKDRH